MRTYDLLYQSKINVKLENLARSSLIATAFVLPLSTSMTTIFFLLTIFLSLASGNWKEKIQYIINNPIAIGLIAYFSLYLIGTLYTSAPMHEALNQIKRFSWLLFTPLLMILVNNKHTTQRYIINAFLIAMVITLVLSYANFFGLNFHARKIDGGVTVFKDHIIQSFLISFASYLFFFRWYNREKHYYLYGLLYVLMSINVLFMNTGRTGYIVYSVLTLYAFTYTFGWKKSLTYGSILLASLLCAAFLFSPTFRAAVTAVSTNIKQYQQGNHATSVGYRLTWQYNALKLIKEKPVFGFGTAGIEPAYASLPKKETQQTGVVNNTSNEYLNTIVQFGLLGLVVLLFILYQQIYYSFSLPKASRFIFQGLLLSLLVGNIANSWFTDSTQAHLYAIILAICFSALTPNKQT